MCACAYRKYWWKKAEQLIHITGLTSQSDRERRLAKFKTERRCRFALLSLTACSQGLNLTEASTCVFAALSYGVAFSNAPGGASDSAEAALALIKPVLGVLFGSLFAASLYGVATASRAKKLL